MDFRSATNDTTTEQRQLRRLSKLSSVHRPCDRNKGTLETSECLLIDIAVHGDVRVERKEDEKVEFYRDLCREL